MNHVLFSKYPKKTVKGMSNWGYQGEKETSK